MEVESTYEDKSNAPTLFFYGHFDKQPHFTGWREGLGPLTPVIEDGKLYGRGPADDGYSAYACILAIKALQKAGVPYGHCKIVIEGSEESGSRDLSHYMEKLKDRLGKLDVVFILDSGTPSYDYLGISTSLRGNLKFMLETEVLTEGVHSMISGVVPDSFRVMRILLDRIENPKTGKLADCF